MARTARIGQDWPGEATFWLSPLSSSCLPALHWELSYFSQGSAQGLLLHAAFPELCRMKQRVFTLFFSALC